MLKNKCCLYVIISIRFFSITICNLLIESPSYNDYISNKGSVEECNKEENMEVTGASITSCLKWILCNILSNVMYSPHHHQTSAPAINIQSTRRTAPTWCKNISLAVLFGSNNNSYTFLMQSVMCIYTHILHNIEMLVRQKKKDKAGSTSPMF